MIKFDKTKITKLRESKNHSITEAAKELGVPRQKVENWENKGVKPNIDSLADLCNAYGVDPNYFFVRYLVSELDS